MKKLIALAIALLFMVPAFASADDKVSVSGSYELQMYSLDDYDYNSATEDSEDYFYQRFRFATQIKPADDVTAFFRFDLAEGYWGVDYNGLPAARGLTNTGTTGADHQLHVDYAWVKIDKEMYTLTLGQQAFIMGNYINEAIVQGARIDIKTPVVLTFGYSKVDEGASTNDDGVANEDTDLYAFQAAYNSDPFNVAAYYWRLDDDSANDLKTVIGLYGDTKVGMFDIYGELNIFGGSVGATDYDGTQLFLQGKTNINDQWMVGMQVFYAKGDDDANTTVLHTLSDLGDFRPFSYGFIEAWDVTYGIHPFELDAGTGCGSRAAQLITDYQVNENVLLQGSLGYAKPDEDSVTNIDSLLIFNASISYTFATNAKVGLQYNVVSPDMDAGVADDTASALFGRFTISF